METITSLVVLAVVGFAYHKAENWYAGYCIRQEKEMRRQAWINILPQIQEFQAKQWDAIEDYKKSAMLD